MLVLIAAATVAVAASPSPSPSPSAPPQIAHVVTSDRREESIDATSRVTFVVTKEEIVRNGYRTVGEALARVPGVEIEQYGAVGSSVSYGLRGTNSAQVLVLVDGLPAPGSLADTVDLGTFSTAGVRRVEIVEGGGSTLYGTGAIGGVINIITDRDSHAPQGMLRWGSFGDRELQVAAAGFSFDRVVASNAYPIPSYSSYGQSLPGSRQNGDYLASAIRYGGERKFGDVDAALSLGVVDSQGEAPGDYPYSLTQTAIQDELDKDAEATLRFNSKRAVATVQFGGTQQLLTYDCNADVDKTSCFQPSASLSVESRTSASLRNAVDAGSQQILYGADLSRGTVQVNTGGGTIDSIPPATPPPPVTTDALAQTAAYFEDQFALARAVMLHAGVRGERDGSLGGEISPSLGAGALLTSDLSLKINYATAFRAPNASELYYPGYGNPNLHAERAKVGDVTIADSRLLGGASLTWFTNRTNDLIVPVLVYVNPKQYLYVYQPQNVDHALLQGFTFDVATRPVHGVRATLNATDLYAAQDLDAGTRLPNDAVMAVNLGMRWDGSPSGAFGGAGLSERLVGSRGAVDYTAPSFFQPAAYADLTGFVELRAGSHASVFLRGYNLGDERYAEIGGYPMPGRSFAIELRSK